MHCLALGDNDAFNDNYTIYEHHQHHQSISIMSASFYLHWLFSHQTCQNFIKAAVENSDSVGVLCLFKQLNRYSSDLVLYFHQVGGLKKDREMQVFC